MSYAQFFQTREAAIEAAKSWAATVRADWRVGEPIEIVRKDGHVQWCDQWVAPCDKGNTPHTPGTRIRVEAAGGFSRHGEPNRGEASAAFEAIFPVSD